MIKLTVLLLIFWLFIATAFVFAAQSEKDGRTTTFAPIPEKSLTPPPAYQTFSSSSSTSFAVSSSSSTSLAVSSSTEEGAQNKSTKDTPISVNVSHETGPSSSTQITTESSALLSKKSTKDKTKDLVLETDEEVADLTTGGSKGKPNKGNLESAESEGKTRLSTEESSLLQTKKPGDGIKKATKRALSASKVDNETTYSEKTDVEMTPQSDMKKRANISTSSDEDINKSSEKNTNTRVGNKNSGAEKDGNKNSGSEKGGKSPNGGKKGTENPDGSNKKDEDIGEKNKSEGSGNKSTGSAKGGDKCKSKKDKVEEGGNKEGGDTGKKTIPKRKKSDPPSSPNKTSLTWANLQAFSINALLLIFFFIYFATTVYIITHIIEYAFNHSPSTYVSMANE